MATTTNYSFPTPDDTALVKDGASAIRSLGTAVDTQMFTNAGAAINKSLVDAAGDLIYGTADNTVARLAIGTADQVLKVNSGATAPEWGTAPSGGMTLISTTTLSGASIALTSIPSTYVHLQVIIRDFLPANDGAELRMRINNNVTANRTRNLNWSDTPGTQTFNDSFWEITTAHDNAVTQNLTILNIYDYANTVTWKYGTSQSIGVDQTTNTSVSYRFTNNIFNQTGAIDRLDFYCNTGNLTSGTVLLYGVK